MSVAQNEIVAENALPGNPASEWDIIGAGDASIQGFATDISVEPGRHGQLQGQHAVDRLPDRHLSPRLLRRPRRAPGRDRAAVGDAAAEPAGLPDRRRRPAWSTAATGPCRRRGACRPTAVSGIYFAKLVREDPEDGRASHIVFVVRDDTGALRPPLPDLGHDLAGLQPLRRQQPLRRHRPDRARLQGELQPAVHDARCDIRRPSDLVFNAEYPMVRWLERNGYDVSYFDRRRHRSARRRAARAPASSCSVGPRRVLVGRRSAPTSRRRAPPASTSPSSAATRCSGRRAGRTASTAPDTPYRTLVCYKETHANAKIDPLPTVWTGTWRDPRFSPPADGGRPENALTGTHLHGQRLRNDAIQVPAADGKMRFWRNTSRRVARARPGRRRCRTGTLGYEWDEDLDNGFRPAGLVRLSTTTVADVQRTCRTTARPTRRAPRRTT